MEQEIAQLERELKPLKAEAQMLMRRHGKLEAALAAEKKKGLQLSQLLTSRHETASKTTYPKLTHRMQQMNRTTTELEATAAQVVEAFASAISNAGSSRQHSPFVSTSSWTEYKTQEEAYTKQLRLYMRRLMQPYNEKSDCESSSESTRHFWLKVRDPKTVRFRGVDTETHARHSNEMARLKALYPTSEAKKTNAELEVARFSAQIETLKLQLMNDQQSASMDVNTLKHKAREIQKKLSLVQAHLARNLQTVLPELYEALATIQSTPILWADYNLKLSRLHFQKAKIDQVVSYLLKQRSKAVFLTFALEDEKKRHIRTSTLLSAVKNATSQCAHEWSDRIDALQHSVEHPITSPLLTATLTRINQIITNSSAYSASKLLQKVKTLNDIRRQTQRKDHSQIEAEISRIRAAVLHLHALLHQNSIGKVPAATDPKITEAFAKTEAASAALASTMEGILKQHTQASKSVAELPNELQFERNLWIYFFGGKSKHIKQAFDDLSGKLATAKQASN